MRQGAPTQCQALRLRSARPRCQHATYGATHTHTQPRTPAAHTSRAPALPPLHHPPTHPPTRRRLVEEQHGGAPHQRTRNGDALLLPPAQLHPLLPTLGVVAVGQRGDELVGVGQPAQHSRAQHSRAEQWAQGRGGGMGQPAKTARAQHRPESTAQHSTAQHSTAQHSTAQHSTAQHRTAQHRPDQHNTAQHSTAQREQWAQGRRGDGRVGGPAGGGVGPATHAAQGTAGSRLGWQGKGKHVAEEWATKGQASGRQLGEGSSARQWRQQCQGPQGQQRRRRSGAVVQEQCCCHPLCRLLHVSLRRDLVRRHAILRGGGAMCEPVRSLLGVMHISSARHPAGVGGGSSAAGRPGTVKSTP